MALGPVATAVLAAVVLVALYLYKINEIMKQVPAEAKSFGRQPWADEEIREAYERLCKEPTDYLKDLPPKTNRRYVVVGGSGLVGGDIVLHLIRRGQPPSSIRILDFSAPARKELLSAPAAQVGFAKVDITDPASLAAAYAKPWPARVADWPLTVHHTAAVIRPGERSPMVLERTTRVNTGGAVNSLSAARAHGADIFILTSSVSVNIRPAGIFVAPWADRMRGWTQVVADDDIDAPLRPREQFYANYPYSKALAEREVCAANGPGFRTGCVRPGNGIYGSRNDVICGGWLAQRKVVTLMPWVVSNWVSAWNVALAHLQFEAALDGGGGGGRGGDVMPACAGRPFNVTDPGPPQRWSDFFRAARLLSRTGFEWTLGPPVLFYLLSHLIEAWSLLLARAPFLTRAPFRWREMASPAGQLQPALFTAQGFMICDDERARRSVADGGFGYKGGHATFEGTIELIRDWNLVWSMEDEVEEAGWGGAR